uniref:TFIIIC_sub6 domain-containing protein n=1 Tax=Rhabditophanes sp. KR3021 TaxID=114890 RepID=A0AC35TPG6_9BILA
MDLVRILNVTFDKVVAPFCEKVACDVTYECNEKLVHDLEFNLIYVGSPASSEHDQVLFTETVKECDVGEKSFKIDVVGPNYDLIPDGDCVGGSAFLLTGRYNGSEFIQVSYLAENEFTEDFLATQQKDEVNMETGKQVAEVDMETTDKVAEGISMETVDQVAEVPMENEDEVVGETTMDAVADVVDGIVSETTAAVPENAEAPMEVQTTDAGDEVVEKVVERPLVTHLQRRIKPDDPKVVKFDIKWHDNDVEEKPEATAEIDDSEVVIFSCQPIGQDKPMTSEEQLIQNVCNELLEADESVDDDCDESIDIGQETDLDDTEIDDESMAEEEQQEESMACDEAGGKTVEDIEVKEVAGNAAQGETKDEATIEEASVLEAKIIETSPVIESAKTHSQTVESAPRVCNKRNICQVEAHDALEPAAKKIQLEEEPTETAIHVQEVPTENIVPVEEESTGDIIPAEEEPTEKIIQIEAAGIESKELPIAADPLSNLTMNK